MNINSDSNVIDIGCGIGRWADALANKVHSYVGIDFSESMIHLALRRFENYDNAQFYVSSFQNFETVIEKRFDRLIIGGCMYINDTDLTYCFHKIKNFLDKKSIIYLSESIATKNRLTLDDVESKELNDTYSAIYRTVDEYNELYKIFINEGFCIARQDIPFCNNVKKKQKN